MNKYEYISSEKRRLVKLLEDLHHITSEILDNTIKLFEEEDTDFKETLHNSIKRLVDVADILRREAFTRALLFIARFQPLGRELRFAETYMNVTYDLYRITRYCREISRVDEIVGIKPVKEYRDMRQAIKWAKEMVEKAVEAYMENNVEKAKEAIEMDTRLDNLYTNLLEALASEETVPRYYAAKIVIARHVERIGDHAAYIARYVIQ